MVSSSDTSFASHTIIVCRVALGTVCMSHYVTIKSLLNCVLPNPAPKPNLHYILNIKRGDVMRHRHCTYYYVMQADVLAINI